MARYLPRESVLFLHVPRTGGTFVEKVIDLLGVIVGRANADVRNGLPRDHTLIGHRAASKVRPRRIFAIVRHPIAYYESVWKWLTKAQPRPMKKSWSWHPHMSAARLWHPDFGCWVAAMLVEEPLWYTRIVEQFVGPEGGEWCHFVGRTRTVAEDVLAALGLFGYAREAAAVRDRVLAMGPVNAIRAEVDWPRQAMQRVLETEGSVLRRFYGDNLERRIYAPLD